MVVENPAAQLELASPLKDLMRVLLSFEVDYQHCIGSVVTKIKLKGKFNKPVKKGKSRKITEGNIAQKSFTKTKDATETIDKPIQIYRQWYRFLQLAIELEQQNVSIITRVFRNL